VELVEVPRRFDMFFLVVALVVLIGGVSPMVGLVGLVLVLCLCWIRGNDSAGVCGQSRIGFGFLLFFALMSRDGKD
jgi:hypothetical protein